MRARFFSIAVALLIVCLDAASAQSPPPALFAAAVNYTVGSGPQSVAVGDFNGDGKPDLAVANIYSDNVSVLRGNGDGTFQAAVNYDTGTAPSFVAVGDFNGDGKLDLAVGNYDSNNVSVLLGNGDGTFQAPMNYGVGGNPSGVAIADFNGDGKLDLAVTCQSGVISVFLGNGDGTFQAALNVAVGSQPYSVAVGDFNGDGKLDLAVANGFSGNLSVLLGNGDGTFQAAVSYGAGGGLTFSVVAADFNGDGKLDLAVTNSDSGQRDYLDDDDVSVLLGNGDGTFQAAVNYSAGTLPQSVAVGDFNGDGKLDLAVGNYNGNNVSVLLGNGDGTFQAAVNYTVGSGPLGVAVGDFNGDGKPDLAVGNNENTTVAILLNTTVFSEPAMLTSPLPSSTLTGSSATFAWTPDVAATAFWIDVGSAAGGNQYYQSGSLSTSTVSAKVAGLPTNGSTIYVTMYSLISGQWVHNSYTYAAYSSAVNKGVITSPVANSTLTGSSVTFDWSAGTGATAYWLDAGSAAGGNQYYQSGNLGNVLTTSVSGLPTNGDTVYVTLYSLVAGQWLSNAYTYAGYSLASAGGVLTTPTPDSAFTSTTVTFDWTAGAGASAYWLDVGSAAGGNQYSQSGNLGNALTTTVSGLPNNGSTVYVTLYSLIGSQWSGTGYTYTAFNATGSLAAIQTPTPGSTLSGGTATFTWSSDASAAAYWLDIGSAAGGNQYYQSENLGAALTTTVYSLPANSTTIYVTLYSYVGGQWLSNAYTYTSGP